MIRHLHALIPDRRLILRLGGLTAAQAVLQGLLLGALIPILGALLRSDPDFVAAMPWLVASGLGLAAYGLMTVLATPIGFTASSEVASQLRQRLMAHAATLPSGWFTAESKARLARALTADAGNIGTLAVSTGGPAITAVLTPLTIVAVSAAVDWRVSLALAAIVPAAFVALRRTGRINSEVELELEHAATQIASRAIELGQAQPVLRAAGLGQTGTARTGEALDAHREVYLRGLRRATGPDLTFTAVVLTGFVAVLALVAALLVGERIGVAEAIALLVLTVRFTEPLSHLIELIGALHAMDNAIGRVQALLATPALPSHRGDPCPPSAPSHSGIELHGVTFAYPGARDPALIDVELVFPPGTTTALIGPSGSGKTTVIRLVARFFDPDAGAVRVGGVDVRDQPTLLDRITVVFQDVYLFDDTIEENLRIARPAASREDLERAASAAALDDVIARLPDGWATRVGEGGTALSGGERQRVSIARAFLKDAPIVLIDEAASALDPENERAVGRAIARLAETPDRTVIVIAHRPATLEAADRVVALDRGRVVEVGNPRTLREGNGLYARLHRRYEHASRWRITTRPVPTQE